MRGIADQCATRLARHGGAAAFTADELSMLCWAYSKLRVRRCLNIPSTTIVAPLDRHVHAALNALSATAMQQKLPVIAHDVCAEGAAGMFGKHTSRHMRESRSLLFFVTAGNAGS